MAIPVLRVLTPFELLGTKSFGYINGKLTTVNGAGADKRTITYTDGLVSKVVTLKAGVTTTKAITYTNGAISGVTVT